MSDAVAEAGATASLSFLPSLAGSKAILLTPEEPATDEHALAVDIAGLRDVRRNHRGVVVRHQLAALTPWQFKTASSRRDSPGRKPPFDSDGFVVLVGPVAIGQFRIEFRGPVDVATLDDFADRQSLTL